MLSLNYDVKNDILYIAFSDKSFSYGDEIFDGYVIMKDIESNEITGVTIFDFKAKYETDAIPHFKLPIILDYERDVIPLL